MAPAVASLCIGEAREEREEEVQGGGRVVLVEEEEEAVTVIADRLVLPYDVWLLIRDCSVSSQSQVLLTQYQFSSVSIQSQVLLILGLLLSN